MLVCVCLHSTVPDGPGVPAAIAEAAEEEEIVEASVDDTSVPVGKASLDLEGITAVSAQNADDEQNIEEEQVRQEIAEAEEQARDAEIAAKKPESEDEESDED